MKKVCKNCNSVVSQLHKHHIVPKSRGGSDLPENLIKLCLECHGKAHDVSFKSKAGLVAEGITKFKEREKLADDFFLNEGGVVDEFLLALEDEDYDMYNFIVCGLLLGIINKGFLYSLIHPEHIGKKGSVINFTQYHQKRLYSIYQESKI